MKAKEYLSRSGYNENWPISLEQICRLMEGYSIHKLKIIEKIRTDIKGEISALAPFSDHQRGQKAGLKRALEFFNRLDR